MTESWQADDVQGLCGVALGYKRKNIVTVLFYRYFRSSSLTPSMRLSEMPKSISL